MKEEIYREKIFRLKKLNTRVIFFECEGQLAKKTKEKKIKIIRVQRDEEKNQNYGIFLAK